MRQRLVSLLLLAVLAAPVAAADSDAGATYRFLEELYNRFDRTLQPYLISELEQYLAVYPAGARADRALYLLGRTYEDAGDRHQALAAYAKLLYLYPSSDERAAALDALRAILGREKFYADQRGRLEALLREADGSGSRADRHYAYLSFLSKLDATHLHERLLAECTAFKRDYPLDSRLPHLDLWIAVSWANKGGSLESAQAFRKFEALYPDDPSLPYARYTRAELLSRELNGGQQAISILRGLVASFPDSRYAPRALFLLGETQARLKDYKQAIADYRRLADEYAADEAAPDALLAVAEIQERQLKDLPAAVATLKELPERFPGEARGAEALERAATLETQRLGDHRGAAATFASVADYFPQHERAAEDLLKAGKLHEEKTGDLQAALAYYRLALERYPGDRKAGELGRRAQRLSERLGG